MGYDYRGASTSPVGSVAPIGGPTYDIARHGRGPTSAGSRPRRSSSACRTTAAPGRPPPSALHARNISGTKYGASTTVVYGTARQYAADHGQQVGPGRGRPPGPSTGARTARRGTAASTPWRQIYYDDATALGLKYDLINRDEPARRRDLGARLRRDADRAVRGAQGQVHHRQGPAGDHRASLIERAVRLAQRRRPDRTPSRLACDRDRPHQVRLGGRASSAGSRAPRSAPASSVGKTRRLHLGRPDERGQAGPRRASTGSRSGPPTPRTTGPRSPRSSPSIAARPSMTALARSGLHLARRRRPDGRGQAVDPRRRGRSPGPPGSSTDRRATIRRWTFTADHGQDLGLERPRRAPVATVAGWPVHAPGRRPRPGRQPDRPRPRRSASTGRSGRSTWARASFVPRAGASDRAHVRPPPAGDGHGGDLPGVDPGPHDLDGPDARRRAATAGRGTARRLPGAFVKPGTYRVVVDATSSIGASRISRDRHRQGTVAARADPTRLGRP